MVLAVYKDGGILMNLTCFIDCNDLLMRHKIFNKDFKEQ